MVRHDSHEGGDPEVPVAGQRSGPSARYCGASRNAARDAAATPWMPTQSG